MCVSVFVYVCLFVCACAAVYFVFAYEWKLSNSYSIRYVPKAPDLITEALELNHTL